MPGKIFYRERAKVKDGARSPRFRIIAVSDLNLKVYGSHMRLKELQHIATECEAKLVQLKRGNKKAKTKESKKKTK